MMKNVNAQEMFNQEALKMVADAIRPQAIAKSEDTQVPLTASSLMDYLCEELYLALSVNAFQALTFSSEQLKACAHAAVNARVAYVSGVRIVGKHPKDVRYPAVFGPILAVVGKVVDVERNMTIVPTLKADALNAKGELELPSYYDVVMSALQAYGVHIAYGLPLVKEAADDSLYRIAEADGVLTGCSKDTPPAFLLLSRALLHFSELTALFGANRVQYCAVTQLRSAVAEVAIRAVAARMR